MIKKVVVCSTNVKKMCELILSEYVQQFWSTTRMSYEENLFFRNGNAIIFLI